VPTQIYKLKDGTIVSGNTTIIGSNLGWKTGGLTYWACAQGQKYPNLPTHEALNLARDAAADAGTVCHMMIECSIKDKKFETKDIKREILSLAETGFLNYLEWKEMVHLEPFTMEAAEVSEKYGYGTTIDILARVNKKRSIVEIKTSNDVYEDMLIQVAAQKQVWDENHPDQKIEALHLLKLNKESASFSHHYWNALPEAFEAFLHLLELHKLHKILKRKK